MSKLPAYQRDLLQEALPGNASYGEIAVRNRLSIEAVEGAIQSAVQHVARHLHRSNASNGASAGRPRKRPFLSLAGAAFIGWLAMTSDLAIAQMVMPVQSRQLEPTRPLAHPPQSGSGRILNSTGFFVDGTGHVLTARHAVESCARIIVGKEKYRFAARLVGQSSRYDLALLKVPRTLGLSAVFPRTMHRAPTRWSLPARTAHSQMHQQVVVFCPMRA